MIKLIFYNLLIISDNVYQPSRCEKVIEELRQCCIINSESLVCEGIDKSKPYEHNTVDYVSYFINQIN